jgi:hypothetical protein
MNKSIPEAVVEAVARAICVACEENPDRKGDARGNKYRWQDYRDVALAAVNAFTAGPQQPAATSETVNVIGMPEFDGLLDHIYEHGTAAEGVIEKANAFARAVIARYAPQQPTNDEVVDGVWAGRGRRL